METIENNMKIQDEHVNRKKSSFISSTFLHQFLPIDVIVVSKKSWHRLNIALYKAFWIMFNAYMYNSFKAHVLR